MAGAMTARPRLSRAALAKAAKCTRLKQRQGLGKLKDRLVRERTLRTYRAHLQLFVTWMRVTGRRIPQRTLEFDTMLCEYAQCLWEEGDARSVLSNTLCAVTHEVRVLKNQLNGAWQLHNCWSRIELPKRAPAIPSNTARGIAGYFLKRGFEGTCLMVLIAHHCILRTAEMLSLLSTDITFSDVGALLVLRDTKMGGRIGVTEQVTVTEPALRRALERWVSKRMRGLPVCELSAYKFRKTWHEAIRRLHLPPETQPYGLRRGGATTLFQHSGTFDTVANVGRWNTLKACRVYVTTALAEWNSWTQSLASVNACDEHGALLQALL